MTNTLVACFSPTGTTWGVAQVIASVVSCELFRINPETPYTPADLNWNDPKSRTSLEMKNVASRPEIADKVENMGDFGMVFLGFPIWWYDAPRIIYTFLDSYEFTGKNMVPFATSGGSGLGKIPQNLQQACPSANWQEGICFADRANPAAVEKWVKDQHGWKK